MRSLSVFILSLAVLLPVAAEAQRRGKKKASEQQAAPKAPFQVPVDYRPAGAPMPPMRIVGLRGQVWTNDSLRNGRNSFVMLFNPGCDHCQMLTKAVQKDTLMTSRNNFIMVAGDMMRKEAEHFSREMNMARYPRLRMGLDSSGVINNIFLYQSIPQVNVYSPEGKLIRAYSAITTTDSLRQYIEP